MNIQQQYGSLVTVLIALLWGYLPPGMAETSSPLDVDQHPASPNYESAFPEKIVPIDTQLSWKYRFLGGELFNAEESLPPTSPELERLNLDSGMDSLKTDGLNSAGFDTTGVVQQVKASEGKVKIKHGPIDRLGMPGMTMVFRVADSSLLAGLDKGVEVAFNVDNTAAGFSITRIVPKPASFDTSGVVQQVKASEGKVKIKHGPIDRLGMPGMTMMFRVKDPGQLAGLEKGVEINFNVDNTAAGFAITDLERVGAGAASQFDARGTVRSIRSSQGKVKIEHGPIDKYGMPGMTMMFKVSDPAVLSMLERDMPVEFNLVNGSGGFEISRIQPMTAMTNSQCYVIGPFRQQAQALAVSKRYQGRGVMLELKSGGDREYVGDMVYIDGNDTREDAVAIANDLKKRGINDYLILHEPGKRNVLSLGVFGQSQNVAKVKARVEAMNYKVKTEPRYRKQKGYSLHYKQMNQGGLMNLLTVNETEAGISQTSANCRNGGES